MLKTMVHAHSIMHLPNNLFIYYNKESRKNDPLQHLFDTASSLAVPGDTKETLIKLINYGDNWIKQYNYIDSNWTYRYLSYHSFLHAHWLIHLRLSNWEKVIGCMADVRIDTRINSILSNDVLTYNFQASADSRVARGLPTYHSLSR